MDIPQKIINKLSATKWYHATTMQNYLNIKKNGVRVDYNKGHQLDFGYGFYLTSTSKLAESYTKRLYSFENANELIVDDFPVIMEYTFCPYDWFLSETYNCRVFASFDDEFAEFVFHNRTANINGACQHEYDVIYGVMSDSFPTNLILEYFAGTCSKNEVLSALKKNNSMKQISLHSQTLCDIIQLSLAYTYNPLTDERKELDWHE